MAQRVDVTFIDDITGEEIKKGKGGPTTFGLGNSTYTIDLTDKNQKALEDLLQPYIDKAQKMRIGGAGTAGKPVRRSRVGPDPREIRDWARTNGHEVPDRGRIPGEVKKAFEEAHA